MTLAGAFPVIQKNISFYWGQTFRLGENNYHSFDISYERYYRYCIGSGFKGFGLRVDNFQSDNYSISIRYFRSLVRRPQLICIPYWSVSPVLFQFQKNTGFNIKPELGLRFNTDAFTRGFPISLCLNVSYGYDIPVINEKQFVAGRHDLSAKIALSFNLHKLTNWFDRDIRQNIGDGIEQTNTGFDNFIKSFPISTLPANIKYSESEFKTEYYTPEDSASKKDSIPYHDHVFQKDSSLIIKYELVKLFLLADTEKVAPTFVINNPVVDTIYPTYYISTLLMIDKNFVCLVYERQFDMGTGNPCAEKYLCTITKTGKLIDKILVASANYSGTGILDEGFRVPWFPKTQSFLNSDLSIVFKDSNYGDFNYQIDDNGKINLNKVSH